MSVSIYVKGDMDGHINFNNANAAAIGRLVGLDFNSRNGGELSVDDMPQVRQRILEMLNTDKRKAAVRAYSVDGNWHNLGLDDAGIKWRLESLEKVIVKAQLRNQPIYWA